MLSLNLSYGKVSSTQSRQSGMRRRHASTPNSHFMLRRTSFYARSTWVQRPWSGLLCAQNPTSIPFRLSMSIDASPLANEVPWDEERLPNYDPKLFYPVDPGSILHGRYRIISKLGFGASSTVWLAQTSKRYNSIQCLYHGLII